MSIEMVLTILGGFSTVGLGINAFFLRGIFLDLNAVKVSQAIIIANSESKEKRIAEVEKEVKDLRNKYHAINTEIHQLKSYELLKDMES